MRATRRRQVHFRYRGKTNRKGRRDCWILFRRELNPNGALPWHDIGGSQCHNCCDKCRCGCHAARGETGGMERYCRPWCCRPMSDDRDFMKHAHWIEARTTYCSELCWKMDRQARLAPPAPGTDGKEGTGADET